ncbi:hypothetical protein PASE110613_17800 [Paenibacillus sediminis]|uniref:Uncharacterized protein n=1 Tax=Paenibacillus sediminis TaxID=664909 RepID=A0ABS4H820_9BACL|nr:hypothetical protein [Paenibacillus sediminis]MBP1938668.1 hypothetical protein [Paenibacillus sediminis]
MINFLANRVHVFINKLLLFAVFLNIYDYVYSLVTHKTFEVDVVRIICFAIGFTIASQEDDNKLYTNYKFKIFDVWILGFIGISLVVFLLIDYFNDQKIEIINLIKGLVLTVFGFIFYLVLIYIHKSILNKFRERL